MNPFKLLTEVDPIDPSQRWRKYGLIASLLGVVILVSLLSVLSINGTASVALYAASVPAALLLVVTAASCWTNYWVKQVLFFVLLGLNSTIWIAGYFEIYFIGIKVHAFALYFFLPLIITSLMNHKAIFALAPFQFVLVFDATQIYVEKFYSDEFKSAETATYVALVCAGLSAISFVIIGLISMIRDASDRKLMKVIEENRALANTDPLTGLANRRAFLQKLEVLWQKRKPFMLVYMDLLRFKPLNDQYGHAAGDAVLKEIARRMCEHPDIKYAARLGGDEFAMVLDRSVDDERLVEVMDRVHGHLTTDFKTGFGLLHVGASLGCARAFADASSVALLTSAADTAMRRARNRAETWARFSKNVDEASLTSSAIEVAFKGALDVGKICAAVQPFASCQTHEIVGYELLSRWVDSEFDENPRPDQFIPIAEKLGLLNELLWRTLDEALSTLQLSELKLSVNVSPGQMSAPDFLPRFLTILEKRKVSPRSIILEVTEQVAFRNLQRNVEVLSQARDLGMSVALDDFGTGYASLSIVEALPLDKIKIDRSFVKPSEAGSRSDAILSAAIKMCNQLNLVCCVEGVETDAVAANVNALGADEIQGYLLGRPCLISDLMKKQMTA